MRRPFSPLFALALLLAACAPTATLVQGETEMFVSLSGDVIVTAPAPIAYADVRLRADSVVSTALVGAERSAAGFWRLSSPEGPDYGTCLRIASENASSGWVGLTMVGITDRSESAELSTVRRKAPTGCCRCHP